MEKPGFFERLRYAVSGRFEPAEVKQMRADLGLWGQGKDAREARIRELEQKLKYQPPADSRIRGLEQGIAAANETARLQKQGKDSAYAERNRCVVLIVKLALRMGWTAGVAQHEDKPGQQWDADWRTIVFVDLPAGQVSWHFHDSEVEMLAELPKYPEKWDGHDVAEKYRRCADL